MNHDHSIVSSATWQDVNPQNITKRFRINNSGWNDTTIKCNIPTRRMKRRKEDLCDGRVEECDQMSPNRRLFLLKERSDRGGPISRICECMYVCLSVTQTNTVYSPWVGHLVGFAHASKISLIGKIIVDNCPTWGPPTYNNSRSVY